MKKNNLIVGGVILVLILVGGGYYFTQTASGKNWCLQYSFNKAYKNNHADAFRSALPTRLPKDRPFDFEFFYENRDDQKDYSEALFIGPEESYRKITTGGTITKTPIQIDETTRDSLYQALRSIPFDQIKAESIDILPAAAKPINITIGANGAASSGTEVEKEIKTKQETLRVSFGSGVVDRQNFLLVDGPSTKIANESQDNWKMAKNLAEKILQKFPR